MLFKLNLYFIFLKVNLGYISDSCHPAFNSLSFSGAETAQTASFIVTYLTNSTNPTKLTDLCNIARYSLISVNNEVIFLLW